MQDYADALPVTVEILVQRKDGATVFDAYRAQ
jgi:hypothetical protein